MGHILCNSTMLLMDVRFLSPDTEDGYWAHGCFQHPHHLWFSLFDVFKSDLSKLFTKQLLFGVSFHRIWQKIKFDLSILILYNLVYIHTFMTKWSWKSLVADAGTGPDVCISAYGQLLAKWESKNWGIDPNLRICFCSLWRKI